MLGAAEPALRRLDPALSARAMALRALADATRMRRELASLPAPRGRAHAPAEIAATDELLLGSFRAADWEAQLRPFEDRDALALVGALPKRPERLASLAGVNVVAVRDGTGRVRARGSAGDFTAVIFQRRSRSLARRFAQALVALAGQDAAILLREPRDLPVIGPVLGRLVPFVDDFLRSDHVPFWEAGLPVVQITDTANFRNPHYHRSTDTPDTVDVQRLADIVAAAGLTLEVLAEPAG